MNAARIASALSISAVVRNFFGLVAISVLKERDRLATWAETCPWWLVWSAASKSCARGSELPWVLRDVGR